MGNRSSEQELAEASLGSMTARRPQNRHLERKNCLAGKRAQGLLENGVLRRRHVRMAGSDVFRRAPFGARAGPSVWQYLRSQFNLAPVAGTCLFPPRFA